MNYSRLTYLVLAVTFGVALFVVRGTTTHIGPLGPALIQLTILFGPYLGLAAIAWFTRGYQPLSLIVLIITTLLCLFGIYIGAEEYVEFQKRDPNEPGGSNWLPFLAAVAQWLVVCCLAVIAVPLTYLHQKRDHPKGSGKPTSH